MSEISLKEALIGTTVAALLLGVVLLRSVSEVAVPIMEKYGLTEKQSVTIVKNLYLTLFPFSNGLFLLLWSKVSKKMRFTKFWPEALLAGIVLHYIDIGIIVPWFFRIAEVFSR